MKVVLLLVLVLAGQEPQKQSVPMPDIAYCLKVVENVLLNPPSKLIEDGGYMQAGCVLVADKEPRA